MQNSKLQLTNRSKWLDEFVRPVCEWIIKQAGITWRYTIILPNTTKWAGRGWKYKQRSRVPRHYGRKGKNAWPKLTKDHRYNWAATHTLNNRLESFVYMIAHEACHANTGHPDRFVNPNGTTNADSMEFHCNDFAYKTVAAFREEWPKSLKAKVVKDMRKNRKRNRKQKEVKVMKRILKGDPAVKLAAAQKAVKKWETKLKRAQTALKKYQRRVRLYEKKLDGPALKSAAMSE